MRQILRLTGTLLRAYARDRAALFFALFVPLLLLIIFGSLRFDALVRQPAGDGRYVDFLVPGILGMNVMQLNIFSVAFALVAQRQRGVLRRIFATPLDPRRFLAAHGLMRLGLSMVQVLILVAVAFALFQVRIVGGLVDLLIVAIVGAIPFLMQGFAIAGWARTENQVPPVANLITLPQFFLSGVFFPKEAAPDVIRPITDVLPLTLLNDALREVSTQGASLWDVRAPLLGLAIWGVVSFALAVRLLRVRED